MWSAMWREDAWKSIEQPFDVIIIGGGCTGAAILHEVTRAGLRALLVEQRDFAWGASSRSTKLVHGGLRYLPHGQFHLVRESIQERQRLLVEGPGLVKPLGFLLASYRRKRGERWKNQLGIAFYNFLAWHRTLRRYDPMRFHLLAPHVTQRGLELGLGYDEAETDDARLTLRVLQGAVAQGGIALNYVRATELLRAHGSIVGVRLHDLVRDQMAKVQARVVINAAGAWADEVRAQLGAAPCLRLLRGSHLVFPGWRLPLAQAISFRHPLDGRPVCAVPWEGVTLIGTTDLDHDQSLATEPTITPEEVAYLMAAVAAVFPSLELNLDDVIATYSGVRPVVEAGQQDPGKEPRERIVLDEQGLVTVTGGKLTTLRLSGRDALAAIRPRLGNLPLLDVSVPILAPPPQELDGPLSKEVRLRLLGRYGADAVALVTAARPGELEPVPGTETLWAELRWAARSEAVIHLDDLLLRRVRLGIVLPQGGRDQLPIIRALCQEELGWDDETWEVEEAAYLALWRAHYSLPERALIPDWQVMLAAADVRTEVVASYGLRRLGWLIGVVALLLPLTVILVQRWERRFVRAY